MRETTRKGPHWSSTWAITSSVLMSVTSPTNRLRAELATPPGGPGGEAWLVVPLWEKPSIDGPPDLSGRERERRFGQWDHVRQYGRDFAQRIAAAGFEVEMLDASALPPDQVRRMALADTLFRALRPA